MGPLHTNAYIYSIAKKECIVIDPGADFHLLQKKLETINLRPQAILLTHGYIDHISASVQLVQAYNEIVENIPVIIHEDDAHLLGESGRKIQQKLLAESGNHELLEKLDTDFPQADIVCRDGDTILDTGLKVLHTPGRSRGSMCLYEEEQKILFTGDTLLFKGIGNTNLPEADKEQLLESVRNRIFSLPPETVIFPGHGPRTTVEREKNNNPEFRV